MDETAKRYVIGIGQARCLQLKEKRYAKPLEHPGIPYSSVAKANPPFEFEDQIIGTTDPEHPTQVTELPLDPRKPNSDQRNYFVFCRRMSRSGGSAGDHPRAARQGRPEENGGHYRAAGLPPDAAARMKMGPVTAVREGSPGDKAGVTPRDKSGKRNGDVIESVEVREADGRVIRYVEKPTYAPKLVGALVLPPLMSVVATQALLQQPELPLDPVRLPDQLRPGPNGSARIVSVRSGSRGSSPGRGPQRTEDVDAHLGRQLALHREAPMNMHAPLSIAELGIAYTIQTTVVDLDQPTDNGLLPGDFIKKIRIDRYDTEDKVKEGREAKLDTDRWAHVFWILQDPTIEKVVLEVGRKGETRTITVKPSQVLDWPNEMRGLLPFLEIDRRLQRADNIFEAVNLGFKDTLNNMGQVYMTIVQMFAGKVSVENLGGPLTIGYIGFRYAGIDFWEFLFFLGLISVNLAVVNFLPIPVLDGGHMVFLIYEKIRGKPASEAVRIGATYAGLLMLASLMIFVFYLDIKRFFFSP